ncbi:MAG: 50S ribosomal protein L9 [Candidatus Margulisbacteria bacterium]|nr:50S ribosomal protein L9 [Candidatus Margulisiibacteriota bacterium]
MEVVITKENTELGEKGSILKVRAGYARNYLFPRGLAAELNTSMKKHLATITKQREKKLNKEKEAKVAEIKTLEEKQYHIKVKAGEKGKLYGAVTHAQVADVITEQSGLKVDKRKIHCETIKKAGEYEVQIKYYPGVDAKVKLKVEAEQEEE